MKENLVLKTRTDMSATMILTLVLWLCSLVLVGLIFVPLVGPKVAWILALGLLIVDLALCWSVCAFRVVGCKEHEARR